MDQTLRQLGELLLGAVPTVILLAVLYALYTCSCIRPLTAVLAERRNRTRVRWKRRAPISPPPRPAPPTTNSACAKPHKDFPEPGSSPPAGQRRSAAEAVARPAPSAQEQVKQARAAIEQDKQQAAASLGEASVRAWRARLRVPCYNRHSAPSQVEDDESQKYRPRVGIGTLIAFVLLAAVSFPPAVLGMNSARIFAQERRHNRLRPSRCLRPHRRSLKKPAQKPTQEAAQPPQKEGQPSFEQNLTKETRAAEGWPRSRRENEREARAKRCEENANLKHSPDGEEAGQADRFERA